MNQRSGTDVLTSQGQLEWLARISPSYRREAAERERSEIREAHHDEQSRWLSTISAQSVSETNRESVRTFVRAVAHPERAIPLAEAEWDPAKHPRRGGPPNAGWFATTGVTDASSRRKKSEPKSLPPVPWSPDAALDARAKSKIASRSGRKWDGNRVLHVLRSITPGWLAFIVKRVTLRRASNESEEPSIEVRIGELGPLIDDVKHSNAYHIGSSTIHFEIPPNWNDVQVAQYILGQLADNDTLHRIATDWAGNKPKLFKQIRDERFRKGLKTVAALAESYYTTLASLAPGGQAAVVAWDIQKGDKLGAALNAAFMLPLGRIAKAGIEFSGTIAIREGEKLIAALPVKVIERIQKLEPEVQALLHKRLLAAESKTDAILAVNRILDTNYHGHHPLPMFLAGHRKQLLAKIPEKIHLEFHRELSDELKAAGLTLRIGSESGSTDQWAKYLTANPGFQGRAYAAILKTSRAMDVKHGTDITSWVWKNLIGQNFTAFP